MTVEQLLALLREWDICIVHSDFGLMAATSKVLDGTVGGPEHPAEDWELSAGNFPKGIAAIEAFKALAALGAIKEHE